MSSGMNITRGVPQESRSSRAGGRDQSSSSRSSNSSGQSASENSNASSAVANSPGNSDQAQNARQSRQSQGKSQQSSQNPFSSDQADAEPSEEELSRRERQKVEELERKDEKVRKHEQSHLSAGGQYVRGGLELDYKRGPDGERYAVGGSVSLDVSRARSPEKTVQKMRQVRAAALAPAQPSPKDLQVAQSAAKKASQARERMAEQRQEELEETREKIQEATSGDDQSSGSVGSSSFQPQPIQTGRGSSGSQTGTGENQSGEEQSRQVAPEQQTTPRKPSSFKDGSESVAPEISDSISTPAPAVEELNIVNGSAGSTDDSGGDSVSAPQSAFNTTGGSIGQTTATLGSNLDMSV